MGLNVHRRKMILAKRIIINIITMANRMKERLQSSAGI